MKNLIIILLLLSGVASLAAQEKVWLNKKYQWTDNPSQATKYAIVTKEDNTTKVEEFTLDGQKKDTWHFKQYAKEPRERIREGLHTCIYANGTDSLVEVFRNNRREGQSIVYYPDGATRFVTTFKDGRRNGKLLQYYPDGKLRREEYYTNNKCTGGKLFAEDGSELEFQPYEVMPVFPNGGIPTLVKLVSSVIKYPKEAERRKIEGRVVLQFIVDTDGTMVSPVILKSVNTDIDQEALRAMNAIAATYKWSPGYQDGKAKRMKFTIPLNFKLPLKPY